MIRTPLTTTGALPRARPDQRQALLALRMHRGTAQVGPTTAPRELGDRTQFVRRRVLGSQLGDLPGQLPAHRDRRTLQPGTRRPPRKDHIDSPGLRTLLRRRPLLSPACDAGAPEGLPSPERVVMRVLKGEPLRTRIRLTRFRGTRFLGLRFLETRNRADLRFCGSRPLGTPLAVLRIRTLVRVDGAAVDPHHPLVLPQLGFMPTVFVATSIGPTRALKLAPPGGV